MVKTNLESSLSGTEIDPWGTSITLIFFKKQIDANIVATPNLNWSTKIFLGFKWAILMENILQNSNQTIDKKIDWPTIQNEMKKRFGNDIFESWLKKIELIEEYNNYILFSVSTRFIRDWITSRYLDQILQIIKEYKREIIRIEFIIEDKKNVKSSDLNINLEEQQNNIKNDNVSFIKSSFLQYNRIDPNKNFDNFITGSSNKLAFEASKKSFWKYCSL